MAHKNTATSAKPPVDTGGAHQSQAVDAQLPPPINDEGVDKDQSDANDNPSQDKDAEDGLIKVKVINSESRPRWRGAAYWMLGVTEASVSNETLSALQADAAFVVDVMSNPAIDAP